ncbi:MAG TPA: FMN-binding negative transcriptional regulator [Saprospiraceae bacterium]|nr:FMN-binding negative transcriptional regulator [Saprospiraceae bacterium]
MYNFSYFKEEDQQVLFQFLHDYPFAFLTGSFNNGKQVATQVPVLVEERAGKLILHAHIMRKTDHHKAFLENPQVLVVFTGPSTYVSATWYTNPHMGSTWNYMSVHLRGNIRFVGEQELRSLLDRLTLRFENNNSTSPTYFNNLSDDYIKHMLPSIEAFEIEVEEIENVFKLSQNRDEKSYLNIIDQLEKRGPDSSRIAAEMRNRKEKLFPPGVEWDSKKFLS